MVPVSQVDAIPSSLKFHDNHESYIKKEDGELNGNHQLDANTYIKVKGSANIFQYLQKSLIEGCDTTSDVIIQCSDGVIPTHKLVLASISKMLYSVFREDTWDEPISILMKDFTVDQMMKYFEDLYNGLNLTKHILINSCISYIGSKEYTKEESSFSDHEYANDNSNSDSDQESEDTAKLLKVENIIGLRKQESKVKKIKSGIKVRVKISESRKYFADDPDDEYKILCTLCNKRVKKGPNSDKMMAHLRLHHPDIHSTMNKKPGSTQKPSRVLGEHYEMIPNNAGKAACKLCNKIMYTGNVVRHLKRVHSIFNEGETQKEWLCSFCGKVFYDKYTRDSHETLVHTKSFKHVCGDCGRGFVSRGALELHMKVHAAGHKYQCSECGNENMTADGRKYTCPCGKKGAFRNPLWGVIKEYQCSDCGQQFCQKTSLNKHQLICKLYINSRDGGDSLTCKGCGQKFSDFKKLRLHSLHSTSCSMLGDKAFPCQECDKQFRTEKRLGIHMRVHTGETPYHCQNCPRKFKYLSHLKNHNCSF